MTTLPSPPPPLVEAQVIRVPRYGVSTLVVEGTVLTTVEDPSVASVHGVRDALFIFGRKPGKTSLTIERPGKAGAVVDIEVGEPVPNAFAVLVGEDLSVPSGGARMSEGEATEATIATVRTPDDATMTIRGHRPGKTQLLFIRLDGSQVVLDVTVVAPVH